MGSSVVGRGWGRVSGRVGRVPGVLGALALVLSGLGVGPSAPASPTLVALPAAAAASLGADGLRVESHTTYTLDLAATTIRVRYEVTLTNQSPDVVGDGFIRQSYYPEFAIGVLSEATNVAATRADGTPLSARTTPTESPRFAQVVADLSPDLYYPDSQTLTITYDLPRLPPRSEGFTRVNEAFATFPVHAVGDPGLTTVEVVLPDHLEVELVGGEMTKSTRDGQTVYLAEAIANPGDFFVGVVARDDERLVRREVDLGEHDIEVLGWPDDPEWADFVAGLVGDGVPILGDLIGIPWPADHDIKVVETVAPYLYGYAGWYMPIAALIEVGDELDSQVILHELAHLWFNDALFRSRWINEALAEELAARAREELGEEPDEPDPLDPDHPGALRLNEWGDPDFQSGDTEEQERYGYTASWTVVRRVVDEVGLGPVAEAVRVAADHHLPYRADTVDTLLPRAADWRTLLDLLEEVSGSAVAEPVFRELVVTSEEAVLLDARAAARTEYAALVEAGDGWAPPAEVRRLMSDWSFDAALALGPDVLDVLTDRDAVAEALAEIDLPVPRALQEEFEGAKRVTDVADVMADALAAGRALRDAQRSRDRGAGPIGTIGLLLSNVDDDLRDARDLMQDGEYSRAESRALAVQDRIEGATVAGIVRLAAVALLGAIAWLVIPRVRRHRTQPGDVV